jgi:2-polyprenyl-6-methoxyphenol hydroxylase-like FAD-dependent oxidoreductase
MRVLVIGGSIGGLATALFLHRVGIDVDIYEQTQELRELALARSVSSKVESVGIEIFPPYVRGSAVWLRPGGVRALIRHSGSSLQGLNAVMKSWLTFPLVQKTS